MIKGFSLLEVIIALTLTLGVLSLVLSTISQATTCQKRITAKQQNLEAIFHAVDMIKHDLSNCGIRIAEAASVIGFTLFQNDNQSFQVKYGIEDEILTENSWEKDTHLLINPSDFFSAKKKIVIYDPGTRCGEFNEINSREGGYLTLANPLQNNYQKGSKIILIKEVSYKIYPKQGTLKRKVNRGYFQPMITGVTEFYIKYFRESQSILYRLEINHKEQVRGYIFLTNMVVK